MRTCGRGEEGGRAGGEGTEGRERGVEERGASQQRQCGVTAMNMLQPSAGDRRFGLERERVGTGERGEGGPPPCAAPARCRAAARPLVLFCRQTGHTHALPPIRTPPSAPTCSHLTLPRTDGRVPPPGALRRQVSVTPPSPTPGPRPPARHAAPRSAAGPSNTSSARRRRHSPPRARAACPHAHNDPMISHTRSLYIHKL